MVTVVPHFVQVLQRLSSSWSSMLGHMVAQASEAISVLKTTQVMLDIAEVKYDGEMECFPKFIHQLYLLFGRQHDGGGQGGLWQPQG
jgi:uncharacterized protein YyaL (SSP411 family)